MKRFCCLVLLVALASGCDSQDPEPDTAGAMEDAAALALRDQLAVERDSVTVELPAALVAEYATAIARVRASEHGGLVEGIHAFPSYVLRDVVLLVDTSASWVVALRRGDAASGEPRVDRLLRDYGLVLAEINVDVESRSAFALIRSESPLNPVALARRFVTVPGVRRAYPNAVGSAGRPDDIQAERPPRGLKLSFIRGSGSSARTGRSPGIWNFHIGGRAIEYLGTRYS